MALSQRRIGWLLGIFCLLLTLAAVRALQLATLNAGRLSSAANLEHVTTVNTPAVRGSIVDRNGALLAVTATAYDISATPKLVSDPVTFAEMLGPVLHVPVTTIEHDLAHPTSSAYYTLLRRQVPDSVAQQVKALKLRGIGLAPDSRRIYPGKYLGAQVLGGVSPFAGGLSGLELEFNQQLAGTPGAQHAVFDAHGQPIDVTGPGPVAGQTVQLTLDAAVQQYTDSVLAATAHKYGAHDATAIILDLRTNAVLAMSNWPRVNANDAAKVGLSENFAAGLDYEPGSTFKVVAIGGALSDGLISPTTRFTIPQSIHVADRVIHDSEFHPTETLTTSQILAQSSNVGAVQIGELLGDTRMYDWMRRFGFGTPTGINLPLEERGIVLPVAKWSGSSIGNMPIGQGVLVTPLQLATAYAAIANGGLLRTPRLVESVGGVAVRRPAGRRILTPAVAAELRSMLRGVLLPGGTASEISIPGYDLAGKTGTASKIVNGVYSSTKYVASFVGFAPEQHPQIEAIVVVDEPRGAIYGTEVAAPAWKQIMNFALPYLKIAPGAGR